jgi:hypothetical protein
MGQITQGNHRDFFARVAIYERINGPFRSLCHFTLPEIAAHIGLATNVGKESDTEWRKRIFTNAAREFVRVADAKAKREEAQ